VSFKSHPYYDNSDAADWLYLRPADWTELEPGPEKALHDYIRAEQARLYDLALDRGIRAAAEALYGGTRPHPTFGIEYHPVGEHGFRAYITCSFSPWPDARAMEDDHWWAILLCPYALTTPPPGTWYTEVLVGYGWILP